MEIVDPIKNAVLRAIWESLIYLPFKIFENWEIFLIIILLLVLISIKLFRPVRTELRKVLNFLLNIF